jgi:dihydroxyacetone kinase
MVVVADDVALIQDGLPDSAVGARGLAGVVLVHKILGACAENGSSAKIKNPFSRF